MKQTKNKLVLSAIAAFLVLFSYSNDSLAAQAGKVIDLRNIDQLKEAFRRDDGKIRFVTILSPT